ncbi:MAG: hypothetical protein Q7T16_04650 [Candidatus Burarchaeum sp.]|nr:hypothetical protein [Candidatus Burarchaeum sp.]MDO8339918.1 hypothetical protein [Candidatus Burarchaeum sp.]
MKTNQTIFTNILGSSPYLKVLGFFLTFDRFDYSKSQVAAEVGISRITIEKIWKDLMARGMIVKSREIGRAELYRLNTESPLVKALQETNFKLASAYADLELQESVPRRIAARA